MKKPVLILSIFFFFSSCFTVLKVVYGVKKPKPRTKEYIQKKANQFGLNQFEHYQLTRLGFINYFKSLKTYNLSSSVNNLYIFNDKGQLLLPKDSITCSGQISNRFDNFKTNSTTVDSIYFKTIFGDTISTFKDTLSKYEINKNFTFVLTWASYAGKLNKTNTKNWADSLKTIVNEQDIDAIFLNLDNQKSWDLNFKSKNH